MKSQVIGPVELADKIEEIKEFAKSEEYSLGEKIYVLEPISKDYAEELSHCSMALHQFIELILENLRDSQEGEERNEQTI